MNVVDAKEKRPLKKNCDNHHPVAEHLQVNFTYSTPGLAM
jgi:hypothetical protein